MSTIAERQSSRDALPVCLDKENLNGLVSLGEMLDFYARDFVLLMDDLASLSFKASLNVLNAAHAKALSANLQKLRSHCVAIDLALSVDQIDRIFEVSNQQPRLTSRHLSGMLETLRERIGDELTRRAFYTVKTDRMEFFKLREFKNTEGTRRMQFKDVTEIFGERVVERLPAAADDLEEACRCFVLRRNKACVFHLMQGVEAAIVKIAKLIEMNDPKPSWGAVLSQLETQVLRTKHKDRSPKVNQHFAFLERVLPEMQAIQRAWRNKVCHVEDRILPKGSYSDGVAENIMGAVRVFIAELASDLPELS